jgi:hypothetical protein
MPVTRRLSLLACGVAVVSLAVSVNTASAQTAAAGRTSTDDSTTTVQVAGQTVAIDRATGKLRPPTAEEKKALAAGLKNMLNRSTEGLTVVQRANGMKSANLQGRFQSIAVANVNSDGRVTEKCVTTQREADAFLKSKTKSGSKASSKRTANASTTQRKGEGR